MPDALKQIGRAALEVKRRLMTSTTPRQRWWLGVSLLGVLAMTGGLVWLSLRVEWRDLYTDMDPRAAEQAATELAAEKIPYQLDAGGTTLRVPANLVDKARLGLAAKGLPQSGRMGFELFDKPNWVGSEFDEQVNYQRALEGELERTISSMGAVESARVHLVLPHDSLFQDQERPAKASVVIKLARRGLSDEEADSIRTLVASAVDGLDPNNVTLVDADGQFFFGQKDAQTQAAAYEQQLTERLIATLAPVAGEDNIRASVNVDFDNSNQDDTQETYDPNGAVASSTERSDESTGTGQPKAAGIPGAASNAPNGGGATNGAAAAPKPLFPPTANPGEVSHQEDNTYLVSKRVRHIEEGPGEVKRLTVAILVNDQLVSTGSGKSAQTKFVPRSQEDLDRIETLAKDAVGFDPARGDQIAVENIAFADNTIPHPPPLLIRMLPRASQISAAMWLLGPMAIFLLLFFFVFRPVGRSFARQLGRPELAAARESRTLPENAIAPSLNEALPETVSYRPVGRVQMLRESVAGRLAEQPEPVVRLVKSWIADAGKSV